MFIEEERKVKIIELLIRDIIYFNIESKEKENVIDEMVIVFDKVGRLNDREVYKVVILNCES